MKGRAVRAGGPGGQVGKGENAHLTRGQEGQGRCVQCVVITGLFCGDDTWEDGGQASACAPGRRSG